MGPSATTKSPDWAHGSERDKALYVDEMGRPLPIGMGRDGEPVYVDLDFFDGRKGGHMSISGISGVATKTSFALFFLRLLAGRPDVLGDGAANLRILVFNVKGEDLLWLDKENRYFDPAAAQIWAKWLRRELWVQMKVRLTASPAAKRF